MVDRKLDVSVQIVIGLVVCVQNLCITAQLSKNKERLIRIDNMVGIMKIELRYQN